MLDPHLLREDPQGIAEALARRGYALDLDRWRELEDRRKDQQTRKEALQARRNQISKEIGAAKKAGDEATASQKQAEAEEIGTELDRIAQAFRQTLNESNQFLLDLPNLPAPEVPTGEDETANVEIRQGGNRPAFEFDPADHVDLGEALGLLDGEAGSKLAGSRFTVLRGIGARLCRALGQFMMDLHVDEHDYSEIAPPLLAWPEILEGTGQLPKFEEDLFRTRDDGLYLIPTAEVPLTNLHRESIAEASELPARYVAWTACFRREAGSYGKDTRGMIRQHQFDKVELVQVVPPEQGLVAWEELCGHAEAVLRRLQIPYRVVELCTGDLGFAARRTYDLEVWLPGQGQYREISSVSWCHDFQARRMGARFREGQGKPRLVHTLNGSGVAIGRTLVAILENFQQRDGSVVVPPALRPYLRGQERIATA